ncbi:PPOX class F420-dependent oxidoreductase [Streptomyces calidiresistens]|uniref:PPOX class F420-dependent oxidoreductase n=1 Tax=Streptomyces calidiresistens TaxID=1485586 RepID=A0A7W3T5I7_9ACTN|nr:PPOX class F420-dependent oxidoreductase [Streptomyces calidiresistens]MBB0231166.1 PPOX class F420-dependent oxidoreductase [Streptomyces calidiresistens]
MSDRTDPHDEITRLGAGKYLLVTTFRRDGRAVPTPVWVVAEGDALFVWTAANSGKVKRLRNRSDVLLAPCDVRGRPTGPGVPGRAELLDAAGSERCRRLIARRYGLSGRLALLGSRLRRGRSGTIGIRLVPVPSDGVTPG